MGDPQSDASDKPLRRIVVVGGGSAGWLTAGLLAAEHRGLLDIVVIESSSVPPIGVGEGTWPTMRDTLHDIGVTETVLVRECDATFKQGSRFNGWVNGRADDIYFHPFVLPEGYAEANLVAAWQQHHASVPFGALVSFQPHLCMQGRAPKQFATPEYAAVANYGYHFDAGRFGPFLRTHCVGQLGVRHVVDDVVAVRSHENGDIAALQLARDGEVAGDLFIDCTGLQSLLLGQHFGIGFISQRHVLFNDRALALQVPYDDEQSPIASQTSSTAHGGGWIWDIGLQSRRGIGAVYSSAHMSDEDAARALQDYVARTRGSPPNATAPNPALLTPRQLSFDPGYRQTFWHRNCVAVGLSGGFLEPLEASALAMIEYAAGLLRDHLPTSRRAMDVVAQRFNDGHRYRWERIVEFLKLHYVLSQRSDTAYWHDNRAPGSIPDRLRDLLQLWRHQPPSRHDFVRHDEAFPSASYQYVLYGMGFVPASMAARRSDDPARAETAFHEAAQRTRKMLGGLPGNRELVNHIRQHGLSKI